VAQKHELAAPHLKICGVAVASAYSCTTQIALQLAAKNYIPRYYHNIYYQIICAPD